MPGSVGGAAGDSGKVGGADPFTGSNSYQPSSGYTSSSNSSGTAFGADPFTGTVHLHSSAPQCKAALLSIIFHFISFPLFYHPII